MKILKGVPPQVPNIFSSDLRSLILGLLTKDPSLRPCINHVLQRPFIREEIKKLLSEVEHGRSKRRDETLPAQTGSPAFGLKHSSTFSNQSEQTGIHHSRQATSSPRTRKASATKSAKTHADRHTPEDHCKPDREEGRRRNSKSSRIPAAKSEADNRQMPDLRHAAMAVNSTDLRESLSKKESEQTASKHS